MRYRGTLLIRALAYGILLSFLPIHTVVQASQKVFSGGADGATWETDENWFPLGVPEAADSVSMNNDGLDVLINEDFSIQSLIIGGKGNVSCTADSYVYGTIEPENAATDSIHVRKNGTLVLKGAGTLVLRGPLHTSEEAITTENSMMLWLQ